MKRLSLLAIIVLLLSVAIAYSEVQRKEIGNLVIENIPEIPASLQERLEQYQNVRSAALAGWASDSKGVYIITRFSETAQVHFVSQPGGARRQLTFYKEPIAGIAVRPTKERGFLFSKDIGGNEQYQIYYFDEENGSIRMLSNGKSRYGSFRWSPDGSKFAYTSNERNNRDFDIYIYDFNSGKTEMVFEAKG